MGCVFCDPKEPIRVCTRFRARVLIFNIEIPITQGFPVSANKALLSHTDTPKQFCQDFSDDNCRIMLCETALCTVVCALTLEMCARLV